MAIGKRYGMSWTAATRPGLRPLESKKQSGLKEANAPTTYAFIRGYSRTWLGAGL